jgi:hypothetical protein
MSREPRAPLIAAGALAVALLVWLAPLAYAGDGRWVCTL